MRTVVKGRLPDPDPTEYHVRCRRCGGEVALEGREMRRKLIGGMDYGPLPTRVGCPTPGCGTMLFVEPPAAQ